MSELGTDPKYEVNLTNMDTDGIVQYIVWKEQDVIQAQTQLEIAWGELRRRGYPV
jgi:hypothetical protein